MKFSEKILKGCMSCSVHWQLAAWPHVVTGKQKSFKKKWPHPSREEGSRRQVIKGGKSVSMRRKNGPGRTVTLGNFRSQIKKLSLGKHKDFQFKLIFLMFLFSPLALVSLNFVALRLDSPKLYPLAPSSLNSITHCLDPLWLVPPSLLAAKFFLLKVFLSVAGFLASAISNFLTEYRVRLQWHRQAWIHFGLSGFV